MATHSHPGGVPRYGFSKAAVMRRLADILETWAGDASRSPACMQQGAAFVCGPASPQLPQSPQQSRPPTTAPLKSDGKHIRKYPLLALSSAVREEADLRVRVEASEERSRGALMEFAEKELEALNTYMWGPLRPDSSPKPDGGHQIPSVRLSVATESLPPTPQPRLSCAATQTDADVDRLHRNSKSCLKRRDPPSNPTSDPIPFTPHQTRRDLLASPSPPSSVPDFQRLIASQPFRDKVGSLTMKNLRAEATRPAAGLCTVCGGFVGQRLLCEECGEELCEECWFSEHQNRKRRDHVPVVLAGR